MWAHIEQAKALVESSWRYHLIAILMTVGVAFFALDQAGRANVSLDDSRKQAAEVEEILRMANDVAVVLRQLLLSDYGDAEEERTQLWQLTRDLHQAQSGLVLASDVFAKAGWPDLNDRLTFNRHANTLLALLYYNDATALTVAPPLDGEPSLLLAEIPLGTIHVKSSIASLHFADLTRLTHAASARPSLVRTTQMLSSAPMAREDYKELMPKMLAAVRKGGSEESRSARTAARALWIRISTAAGGATAENGSIQDLFDRRTELQKVVKAMEDQATGRSNFQLPGIGQTLTAASALWLLPLIVMVLHFLAASNVWQANGHVQSIRSPIERIAGVTSPFLMPHAGPNYRRILAADAIQFVIVFSPLAVMLVVARHSPVAAAQGSWKYLLWLLILASGMASGALYWLLYRLNVSFRTLADRAGNAAVRRVVVPEIQRRARKSRL